MKEIRLHGRGGQGAVTLGQWIVHCLALDGKYGSSIPMFGFERRSAPVASYVRIDDRPVREKCRIYTPDCLVVIDPTVRNAVDIFDGLTGDSILVINQKGTPEELNLPPAVKRVGIVDATAISLRILGRPITNSCMIGAFAATTGWIKPDSIPEALAGNFVGETLAKNIRAAKAGFEQCKIFNLAG